MTLARMLSDRIRSTRSLRQAAMVLSLAALPAAAQKQLWIHQLGTSSYEQALALAPDGYGGLYVSGNTSGSLAGPNAGSSDIWLARYDFVGNQLWIRQLGSTDTDFPYGAAPDGAGGVYVIGFTYGSLAGPNAGGWDLWLTRYDAIGNQLWIRQLGTSADEYAYAAAPDGSGGVYMGGRTFGSLGGPNAGGSDAWLARYDGAGSQVWIRQLGTSADDYLSAGALDGEGGVHVSGWTNGSLGGTSAGGSDAWLARFDGAGNQLWIRQLGTSAFDDASAAAPDGYGGLYVSGLTVGSLGGANAGGADVWLARYDGSGNLLWTRQLGSSADDWPNAAARGGSAGVYVCGLTYGSLGGPHGGGSDIWLARYDSGGSLVWTRQLGMNLDDEANAAAPDGSGGVYVSGRTEGSLGGLNAGGWDAWFARYEGCGVISKYCFAKLNSAGCVPTIATSGKPSASAGSGFTISTTSVLDNKFGLYFYSKSGPSSAPFQGGILCAAAPLVRTMVQDSGGTAPCGGSYNIDFNAYVASGKDPALISGQHVWLQTWSRDPGFAPPSNTSLSDAVSFILCP